MAGKELTDRSFSGRKRKSQERRKISDFAARRLECRWKGKRRLTTMKPSSTQSHPAAAIAYMIRNRRSRTGSHDSAPMKYVLIVAALFLVSSFSQSFGQGSLTP